MRSAPPASPRVRVVFAISCISTPTPYDPVPLIAFTRSSPLLIIPTFDRVGAVAMAGTMAGALSLKSEATSRGARMLRTALGLAIAAWLEDPAVVEVMLNPDGRLWVDRLNEGLADTGEKLSAADGERIVRLVAHHVGAEVHPASPRVSAELPETGERFEGLIPPVVAAPAFAIRKPAVAVFTLDDYAGAGIMTAYQAEVLRNAVAQRCNVLVAGGTSTGKTTLVNALLAEVARTADRVVLIEDTRELQCKVPNLVALRTKDGVASLSDLVRSSLRLRPDRIPIGEVRGAEALDLVKAWGTGHPGGIGTIHAGSALGALRRLEQLVQEAVVTVPRALIAETINLIAVLAGRGSERRLIELARVEGLGPAGDYVLAPAVELTSAGGRT
jgi:P-type conjugative transfer ATPase TrbB